MHRISRFTFQVSRRHFACRNKVWRKGYFKRSVTWISICIWKVYIHSGPNQIVFLFATVLILWLVAGCFFHSKVQWGLLFSTLTLRCLLIEFLEIIKIIIIFGKGNSGRPDFVFKAFPLHSPSFLHQSYHYILFHSLWTHKGAVCLSGNKCFHVPQL